MAKTPKQPAEQDALREDDAPPQDAPETPDPPLNEPAALADQASDDDKAKQDAPAEPDHAAHQESGQPHIDLALFCASHPAKADQLAGFAHYAREKHPSKYTREQWDAHLAAFNDRPIR